MSKIFTWSKLGKCEKFNKFSIKIIWWELRRDAAPDGNWMNRPGANSMAIDHLMAVDLIIASFSGSQDLSLTDKNRCIMASSSR